MRQRQITVVRLVGLLLLLIVSCGPEIDAPELGEAPDSTPETSANAAPARTATVALAEFEGFADPATGRFEIERITPIDPYPQLAAFYEGNGIRTIGQGVQASTLGLSEPAPWCTGNIVSDGTIGTNPPDSFELLTLTGSIASSPGLPLPSQCAAGSTFLYSVLGVFCATVRAHNFYDVPWRNVHAQLYSYTGGIDFAPYALGQGTSVNTNDGSGDPLPEYASLPDPGGAIALWEYGDLDAAGGANSFRDNVWTFRFSSTGTSTFTFRGRVIGNVAENCATPSINEDCDPLDRGDNACRLYDTDEACTDDRDCESYLCNIAPGALVGVCDAQCAAGLFGSSCQTECPGGYDDVCSGHGDCDDGRLGSGVCTCDANFYGADCSVGCTAGQTWTLAGGCVDPPSEFGTSRGDTTRLAVGLNYVGALRDDGTVVFSPSSINTIVPPGFTLAANGGSRFVAIDGKWNSFCGLRDDATPTVECRGTVTGYDGFGAPLPNGNHAWNPPVADVVAMRAGEAHVCVLSSIGQIRCAGYDHNSSTQPVTNSSIIDIDLGAFNTCALLASGGVECWGGFSHGEAFAGTWFATSGRFIAVHAGMYHTCALREDMQVECRDGSWWPTAPNPMDWLSPGPKLGASAGYVHHCVIELNGSLDCGSNEPGYRVNAPGPFVSVSGGMYTSCAIDASDRVTCLPDTQAGNVTNWNPG